MSYHYIEDDLKPGQTAAFAAAGLARLETYLARVAAFQLYLKERGC